MFSRRKRKAVIKDIPYPRFESNDTVGMKIPVKVTVLGTPVGDVFAVTPSYAKIGKFEVTHRPTGRAIGTSHYFKSERMAIKTIKELYTLNIPWDQMTEENSDDNNNKLAGEELEKVKAIIAKYGTKLKEEEPDGRT